MGTRRGRRAGGIGAGIVVLMLLGFGGASGLGAVGAAGVEGRSVGPTAGTSRLQAASPRCRVQAGRSFASTFLEQGDTLDVTAWMDVDCGLQPPAQLDLVLLLDVQPLAGETPDAAYAAALAEGLAPALDWLGWGEGTRVALLRVATAGHAIDLPLDADRAALDAALASLDAEGLEEEGDLGAAIDAAQALIADGAEAGRSGAILLVDAGMPLQTNAEGGVLRPPAAACQRTTAAGTTLGVVSLQAAARRLANVCASPGHFESVGSPDDRKLSVALDQMGRVLARPGSIVAVELTDFIRSTFSYVERSGVPRDPDYIVLAEHVWQFPLLEQRLQQGLDYQVQVNQGFGEIITPLSIESKLVVEYDDGSVAEHPLPNPSLCIHWPGREDFCADWLRESGVQLVLPWITRP